MNIFPSKQKKLGISFRGGAAKGAGYLGFLKLIDELGIEIHHMVGSSIGSYIAAEYAAGFSLEERIKHSESFQMRNWLSFNSITKLEVDNSKLKHWGEMLIKEMEFKDLKIGLGIQVTNLKTFSSEIIEEGSLSQYAMASCAHPVFTEPVLINGTYYADGDLSAGYGFSYLRSKGCDVVIAIDTGDTPHRKASFFERRVFDTLHASRNAILTLDQQVNPPDIIIDGFGEGFRSLDFTKAHEMMTQGYELSKKYENDIKNLLF